MIKAIVLAAGKGKRIAADIGGLPKPLLSFQGKSILLNTVDIIRNYTETIIVCTGYKHELIEKELAGYPIRFYHNPFYSITNNIASLWFAKEEFYKEDVLIISADLILCPEMMEKILSVTGELFLMSDKSRIEKGDYFLGADRNGSIYAYGKNLEVSQRTGENVGVAKVSANAADMFRERLCDFMENERYDAYYEEVFFSFIGGKISLETVDVSEYSWKEIDRYDDYKELIGKGKG